MSELSTSTISIDSPLATVSELLFAFDRYPEWSSSIKAAEALARDEYGRITKVKMTIDDDWSEAPAKVSFSLDDADVLTAMDGSYELKTIDEDTTSVTYSLTVAASIPIPAMMRQKEEKKTIDAALSQLKSALEA